jgi:hypothetical protein
VSPASLFMWWLGLALHRSVAERVSCRLSFRSLPSLTSIWITNAERWLPNEPIVYVGKADQMIQRRLAAFYRHKCGDTSPHAGGQVLKLLSCSLWVYWSPASHPRDCERVMLCAFKEEVHQAPFANWDGQRRRRRIRYL